jgi:hypothetical protein
MDHTHDVSISDHDHSVTIPDHDHSVTIPDHSHSVYIPDHSHGLIYGIFEDTYPQNVFVKINGQEIAGPFGQDGKVFNVDLDLTSYIGTPGTTYNLEVTSARNGRVNVWVSVQAFIQAK